MSDENQPPGPPWVCEGVRGLYTSAVTAVWYVDVLAWWLGDYEEHRDVARAYVFVKLDKQNYTYMRNTCEHACTDLRKVGQICKNAS